MPATAQDRLYGLTTSVAVKPPVYISADYDITRFGEQTIKSKTPTDERTITTTEGMRVLLLGQDNPVENGIWVARRSFWVRATDFNGPRDAVNGTLVFSINGDCWQVEADDPVVIGKSAIHFRPTYPFEANLDIFQRTLRVPEASVNVLPSADERAWKGLGFDGAGQPKLQDPAGTGLWGYVPAIGSFEKGSLLTQRFEVLLWESTDEYWRWDGAMPKIVLPGSTPDTAGGRGKGKWLDVTDATLRSNLGSGEPGMGASLVALNPYGTVQNAITYLTPEMFGAKGDGVTDDYYAIQQMLNVGPAGCTFIFDGAKTYYNAFGNKTPADAWLDLEDRNEWRRTAAATFKFNGAGLRRRYPFWNDNNAKNNMNSGAYYTDDHTALLRLTGAGPFIIEDANFDSGIPTGALVNGDGIPTGQTNYAVGQCMDFGLIIENCTDVTVKSGTFKNSVFPLYVDGCTDVFISANVKYAAQAAKRVTTTDLAYGGGCKVLNSTNAKLFLVGLRNVNTTAEIESLNSNVHVEGWSNLDYSNSLVVFGSQHVHLKWTARNVQNGVGVYIRGGFSAMETNFITGDVIVESASYFGCYVYLAASATTSMYGINLNVQTRNCGSHGLYINAESGSGRVIDGVNCSHQSSGDDGGATGTGAPTRVNGLVKGEIKIDPANAYQGFWASGNNSANTSCVVRFSGNTRGATNSWTITSTMRVDVDIITNTNHYRLTCAQFIDTGAITAGGGYDNSNSYVRTHGRFSQDQATYPLFPKMKGAVSGANYELVYDPNDSVTVEGAKKYNVQLVILN